MASRKRSIQEKFCSQLRLLVDFPKQSEGNTNDSNSTRKFFNVTVSACITEIQEEIISRFGAILEVIASTRTIKLDCFHKYCIETAKLFVKNYQWFPMPVIVHNVLIHGREIIRNFRLSVELLSEETQEVRKKDYRYFREHHTRKDTRFHTNEDLLKILLVSSDPVIVSQIPVSKKSCNKLSPDDNKINGNIRNAKY